MRLWHRDLLPLLSKLRLQGQHRECTALRGLGWGKKHSTVDYVFQHPYGELFCYHLKVIRILENVHHVNIDPRWRMPEYRGKNVGYDNSMFTDISGCDGIYPEHDHDYYLECLENLKEKGIVIKL